jgi:hypothetical protein
MKQRVLGRAASLTTYPKNLTRILRSSAVRSRTSAQIQVRVSGIVLEARIFDQ